MSWTRPEPSLHLLLCIVALVIGVLVWANAIHLATLHAAAGLIIVIIAVLSAL